MNIQEFVKKNQIKINAVLVHSNPNMPDKNWKANHYSVTLQRMSRGDTLSTFFSKGIGLKGYPTAEEVLDCLASDASGVENARNFDEWASEYGYDTDSRKAEKVYDTCVSAAQELKDFLGNSLYQELLYETERE